MGTTNTCMGVYQFDDERKRIFKDIVRPLIETHTGLTYVDGMSHYEPSIKMDLISRLINEANLIIIDVSFRNPNVFLELGIAYAAKKPIVFLCKKERFDLKDEEGGWNKKMPFDIEGKELLIFDDDKNLQVQLGRFISDSLFKTRYITVPWYSTEAKNCIRSSNELDFFSAGNFWSTVGINHTFIMSYHVKVHEFDNSRNPDIRLFFSNSVDSYPRIVVIFPWENSEIDLNRYECHIDYFINSDVNHLRLQTVAVSPKMKTEPFEFDVSISFYHPHLVVECSLFEVNRLIFPIDKLRDFGYGTYKSNFIGFGSGHRITISNILIKEVFT